MLTKTIKMVCSTLPEGQKLTAALLEYSCEISAEVLSPAAYEVSGREVIAAYPVQSEHDFTEMQKSVYVLVELESSGEAGSLLGSTQPGPEGKTIRLPAELSIRQIMPLSSADGKELPAWDMPIAAEGEIEPLVEKFTQHVFYCDRNDRDLPYNLFLPEDYNGEKEFPLVLYIHDRGPLSDEVKTTLRQGIGALTWVGERDQTERPCIVLAPQYAKVPDIDDDPEDPTKPDMLEATFDLLEHIIENYAVDKNRIYTTGQSMGCMASIAMGIRRPDFFTAYYLVAGQWDPQTMTVLSDKKMFIVVSRGDPRAYPTMVEALALMEQHGAVVSRAEWDQDGGIVPEEQVADLRAQPGNIHFAVLKTEKRDFSCHMDTWKVAYGIKGTKEWLFEQEDKA